MRDLPIAGLAGPSKKRRHERKQSPCGICRGYAARAYIDALAAAENVKIKSMIRGSAPQDSLETILTDLEDDDDGEGPHLRVDLVLAAVLTAKAVAGEPGWAKRLFPADIR